MASTQISPNRDSKESPSRYSSTRSDLKFLDPLPSGTTRQKHLHQLWGRSNRPAMARLLESVALDIGFTEGRGPWLRFQPPAGKNRVALDLIGGFGAAFLGHNPPQLTAIARANLDQRLPMLAQGSIRSWSGYLADKLAREVSGSLGGGRFVCHLLSTGSEAVEASLRNCLLLYQQKLEELEYRLEKRLEQMRRWCAGLQAKQLQQVLERTRASTPELAHIRDFEELRISVRQKMASLKTRAPAFIAVEQGYHGSTGMAALLSRAIHEVDPKSRQIAGHEVRIVPSHDPAELQTLLADCSLPFLKPQMEEGQWVVRLSHIPRAAAFIFETIQGEAGAKPIAGSTLRNWCDICRQAGVPVIADEIQTGLGRTGSFLDSARLGIRPDIVLVSKILGGGLSKLSAAIMNLTVYHPDFAVLHGSTFADDECSSRIGIGAIKLLKANDSYRIRHAKRLGHALLSGLKELQQRWPQVIKEVRGRGLLLGIEFQDFCENPSAVIHGLAQMGRLDAVVAGWFLWEESIRLMPVLSKRNVLRLLPPVNTPISELRRFLLALDRLCEFLANGQAHKLVRYLGVRSPAMNSLSGGEDDCFAEATQTFWKRASREPALPIGRAAKVATHAVPFHEKETSAPAAKVAFLGHWRDAESLRYFDPNLAGFSDEFLYRLSERAGKSWGHYVVQEFIVHAETGHDVECRIIGWPAFAGTILKAWRSGDSSLLADIRCAIQEAAGASCSMLGFGASTSIITQACRKALNPYIPVTSGNALTTATALQALERACLESGYRISQERVAVVGALGNLGDICARMLSERVGELILVGRPGSENRLRVLADEVQCFAGGRIPTPMVSTDLHDLREVGIILTTTNSPQPIIHDEHLGDGRIVLLDLAVPGDSAPDLNMRKPNVNRIRGGIVSLPVGNEQITLPGWGLAAGHSYACLAETLVLGLEGARENYSCGSLTCEQVKWISKKAAKQGFRLSELKTNNPL